LIADGWVQAYPDSTAAFYEAHQHRVPLTLPRLGNARLELHTSLLHAAGPFTLGASRVVQDAVPVRWEDRTILVPSHTHGLLHLCMHFAWSHYMTHGVFRAVQDVAALWRATGGFGVELAAVARQAGATTSCYWTLRFARRLLDVPIDDALLRALRPPRAAWLLDVLERHYAAMAGLGSVPCPSARLERLFWELGMMPRADGHAAALPWSVSEGWAAVSGEAETGGAARTGTAARWAGKLARVGRYARSLLGLSRA
jgi:hypothetical protein